MLSQYLNKEKKDIINELGTILMNKKEKGEITLEEIKDAISVWTELGLLELINNCFYKEIYNELFKLCFKKDDMFAEIKNEADFELYRDLIRTMNCISYEKPNSNPEIEKFNNYKRLYNEKSGGGVSFEGIVTSVEAFTGKDTNVMTIYKLHSLFNRISQFKNHDSTTLFRTVADIKVIDWYQDTKKDEKEEVDEKTKKVIEDFMKNGQSKETYQSISRLAKK